MRFEFKPSFRRSLKSFAFPEKDEIKDVTAQLIDFLSSDKPIQQGMGLKRLMKNYWEVRKGLKARILFRWQGDLIEFVLAGNHDDIRRFLRNN